MTRHPQAAAVVALLAAAALAGCGGKQQRPAPPPVAVDAAPVTRQDLATYIQLDGQITPLQQSNLSLPQSGTLLSVYVTEGQSVGAGQVLAKLDDSTLRAQLAQAQAQLGGQTLTGPITTTQSRTTLVAAQQALSNAKNNLISAQAAYENAKVVYDGDRTLFSQGYVSETQLQQARSAYVSAQQTLNNDRELVTAAQAQVANARSGLMSSDVQKQNTAATAAQVQQIQTAISQTTLRAPFAGVITARYLDPGAFAGPNQQIVQISQLDTVYVNANVPDDQLGYVRRGTPVSFTTSSLPGKTFRGGVYDVNATPTQGTLSYRARVMESNPGNLLRGGMLVTVQVRKEFHPRALVVPRTAIFQTDTGSSVFTVVDGKAGPDGKPTKVAKQVPVTVGLQTDVLSEVRGVPFGPGALVITTRPDALQDGSAVAISQPGAPGAGGPGGPSGRKKSGQQQ